MKTDCAIFSCRTGLQKFLVLITASIVFSCAQKKPQQPNNVVKVVEAKGYVVPKDSMAEPKVKPADENKLDEVPAGKPTVTYTNTNIHPAGLPKIILAGKPRICTPGQDTFSLPKIVPVPDSPFAAGIPETVIAKDPYTKDQNPENFSTFGKLQGLKDGNIQDLLEDKYGNLWFGYISGGVTKYDGKNFTHFTAKEGFPYSVESIIEDKSGNLWFAGGGVSRYDGRNFKHFDDKEGMSDGTVYSIIEDHSGNIWFGTNGHGVTKYDGATLTHFTDKEGLPNNYVICILEDKSRNLWFGTASGVSRFDGKSFANFTDKEGLSGNAVVNILEDKAGNLWFGTAGGGVIKYDGKSFANFTVREGLSGNDVRSILEDKSGNLWFGTNGGGITKFDGVTFTHFTDKEGLPNNIVTSILEDRSGNLWFGTTVGVTRYRGKTFTHFTNSEGLTNSGEVHGILDDKAGNLWFGTAGAGVSKYDGKSFTKFTDKEGLAVNVISISEDRSGNLWFGTTKGFTKYDGKVFTHYFDKDGLFNSFVFSIIEDKSGNVWVGTAGGGVSKYDGKFFTKYTNVHGLSEFFIRCMAEDKSGNLWFGTTEGLVKYDGKSFTVFNKKGGLPENYINSIAEDKSGNLWLGTYGGGLSLYDGKSFTNFTEKEGLVNNNVWSVIVDKSENIWAGTRFGLSKLTKDKLAFFSKKVRTNTINAGDVFFKNYTNEDGFLGIGVSGLNSICEDKNGTIWIGANDRLTAYHPPVGGEIVDTAPPNIQLTGIGLFNENIGWANLLTPSTSAKVHQQLKDTSFLLRNGAKISKFKFDSLTKWYGLPENLSLAYNNNFLTFNFIGVTMNQPNKVKYEYKLEGNDDHWSGIISSTEAPYGNLPQGTYTFKVKAMNSEGYWSKEFHYTFTIRPPWWKTWWAYSLYLALFLAALRGFIKWRISVIKKEKTLLEEKLEMQNAVMNERTRISRELHDEVGATLSGIAMYSHLAKEQVRNSGNHAVENSLNIMQQSAGEMVNKLNDIVWLINPDQDSLQKLIQRLEEYARDMAAIKNMSVKVNVPEHLHEHSLPMESRRNIYLFCKEAINNAVKYSNGTMLKLNIKEADNTLEFCVSDNGKGFDAVMVRRGNGLDNMQKRADEIGARLTIHSKQHEGATVSMQVKVT